jgi:hypothetical protein
MAESLVLFESVINSRWFLRTSIILFLNKIDLFKAKLPKVALEHYFPEYTGGSDVNKAAKYILWRFTQLNRARLSIYPQCVPVTLPSDCGLNVVQSDASDRHEQYPARLRRRQGNDPAEYVAPLPLSHSAVLTAS